MKNYEILEKNCKKTNKLMEFVKILLIFIIFISIILSTFSFLKNKNTSKYFYFIQLNSFSTLNEANDFSTEIQTMGAGGYIYHDSNYKVFASVYINKKDAETVVLNLKNDYKNVKIYTLKMKKYKAEKSFTKKQNNQILAIINTSISSINNLIKLSEQFDKNEITHKKLQASVHNITDNFSNKSLDYESTFAINSNTKIKKSKTYLNKIETSLNELSSIENINSKELKYYTMKMIFYFSSFLSF